MSGLGLGQNANIVSASALHDSIVNSRDNYNVIVDRLSRVVVQLVPNP